MTGIEFHVEARSVNLQWVVGRNRGLPTDMAATVPSGLDYGAGLRRFNRIAKRSEIVDTGMHAGAAEYRIRPGAEPTFDRSCRRGLVANLRCAIRAFTRAELRRASKMQCERNKHGRQKLHE